MHRARASAGWLRIERYVPAARPAHIPEAEWDLLH